MAHRQAQAHNPLDGSKAGMWAGPRVSATKLHGPDPGISYSEATEAPVHGVGTTAEAATLAAERHAAAASPKAAAEGYLRRDEESSLAAPAVQTSTSKQLERATASPAVQAAAKETLKKESQSLGRIEDSAARGLDQQAEDVFRLRGGANASAPAVAALATAAAAEAEAEEAVEALHAPAPAGAAALGAPGGPTATTQQAPGAQSTQQEQQGLPALEEQPASSAAGGPLEAYLSPHMREAAQAEQDFDANEAPLFERVEHEVEVAKEEARAAELKTGEAEARVWARVTTRAEEEKREARSIMQEAHAELDRSEQLAQRAQQLQQELSAAEGRAQAKTSPAPRTRRGLLAAAQRLARQAANLEEEAKRKEAKAFYCVKEAEQLDVLCAGKRQRAQGLEAGLKQLEQAADEVVASINTQLAQAKGMYQAAEDNRRRAAELGARPAAPGRSGGSAAAPSTKLLEKEALELTQQADLLAARAELRFLEAEEAVQHADTAKSALLQAQRDARLLGSRADELVRQAEAAAEAAKALMARAADKAEQSLAAKEAAQAAPVQRLAGELEEAQRGRAAAELRAAQLLEQAHRKVQHAGQLEHTAEQSAAHVRRVLGDAAAAHAEEEAALSRAQRAGAAASRRAGARMAEQWLDLVASPEWRSLAHRFPEAIARLEAVATDERHASEGRARGHDGGVAAGGH
ncbi:hypothetical protein ABPG75_003065 [Micractinium tetrahymenae]